MAATSKLLFSFFIEDQMPLEKWQNLHVDAAALTPVFISQSAVVFLGCPCQPVWFFLLDGRCQYVACDAGCWIQIRLRRHLDEKTRDGGWEASLS